MWLKRKLLIVRSKFTKFWWTYARYPPLSYAKDLGQFMCLEPQLFEPIDISRACLETIQCDHKTMTGFLISLSLATDCLQHKIQASFQRQPNTRQAVTVEYFLMAPSLKYTRIDQQIVRFSTNSVQFASLYQAISTAQVGIDGHNQRVLKRLYLEALEIARQLQRYSYDQTTG